jgi:hypothetical protein
VLSSAGGDGVEIPAKSVRLGIVSDTHASFVDPPLQIVGVRARRRRWGARR